MARIIAEMKCFHHGIKQVFIQDKVEKIPPSLCLARFPHGKIFVAGYRVYCVTKGCITKINKRLRVDGGMESLHWSQDGL
jgi:hypothetical protein